MYLPGKPGVPKTPDTYLEWDGQLSYGQGPQGLALSIPNSETYLFSSNGHLLPSNPRSNIPSVLSQPLWLLWTRVLVWVPASENPYSIRQMKRAPVQRSMQGPAMVQRFGSQPIWPKPPNPLRCLVFADMDLNPPLCETTWGFGT